MAATKTANFYTYLHCKPDGTPFYVGKGRGRRAYRLDSRNAHHKKVTEKYGAKNIKVFVFECNSESEALSDEIQQISQLRSEGFLLTNVTRGGDGVSGLKHSKETIEKLRISKKNISNETRQKMSLANKGRSISIERRANTSTRVLGNKYALGNILSVETRQKMSDAKRGNKYRLGTISPNKGKPMCDAQKAKLSATSKGVPWTQARRDAQNNRNGGLLWL